MYSDMKNVQNLVPEQADCVISMVGELERFVVKVFDCTQADCPTPELTKDVFVDMFLACREYIKDPNCDLASIFLLKKLEDKESFNGPEVFITANVRAGVLKAYEHVKGTKFNEMCEKISQLLINHLREEKNKDHYPQTITPSRDDYDWYREREDTWEREARG